MQTGDIKDTLSSKKKLSKYIGNQKTVNYKDGIKYFIDWYKKYYKINDSI